MKIVHITTVHQRFDSRIFYKECSSLNEQFHDVTLIVADGKGNQDINNIHIIDIGAYPSRLKRLLFAPFKAVRIAKRLNADIYHFHDPELLIAVRSLTHSHKVIFDSHEDFPKLMLQRPYIPLPLRKFCFLIAKHIEKKTTKHLFAIVSATDTIKEKFFSYNTLNKDHIITIKNYPLLDTSLATPPLPIPHDTFTACYVGGLTKIRGVKEMILACEKANIKLILAGPFDDKQFLLQMQSLPGWKNVEYLGIVPHKELFSRVYLRSDIGLNMLLSAPNHVDAIPIKQLEYMSAALPVIATEHIRFCVEITNQTQCGILVKPEDIEQCSEAILHLKNDPLLLHQLSSNAYHAALSTYNWTKEKDKLLTLYSL